jgi:hypothetical protein
MSDVNNENNNSNRRFLRQAQDRLFVLRTSLRMTC